MKINNEKRKQIYGKFNILENAIKGLKEIAEEGKEFIQDDIDENKRLTDLVARDLELLHESVVKFTETK